MKIKPIIVVNGDPKSIFLEIFFKSLKFKNFKSPILLISSLKLLEYFKKKYFDNIIKNKLPDVIEIIFIKKPI